MTSSDPLVVFMPSGKRGRVPNGTTILGAARALAVDLDSVCGGRGLCARCQCTPSFGRFPKHGITVDDTALTARNAIEDRCHRQHGLQPERRLGCQARITADLVVDVPPESHVHRQVIRKEVEAGPVTAIPSLQLCYVEVAEPALDNPTGDRERLLAALESQWNLTDVDIDHQVLMVLQSTLRAGNWTATVAIHHSHLRPRLRLLHIWPGFHGGPLHGIAIDLGSTTLAATLCNLQDGTVRASRGAMNPQIRFGEDLMSRVSYAMLNPEGSDRMTDAIRTALDALIIETIKAADVDSASVLELVIVGNPVMHHLLLDLDPSELGQAPFALATTSAMEVAARTLDLDTLNAAANVYILPCIAGHVGADAAAVLLAEEPGKSKDRILILDVGTNAEIIFGDRTRVLACSSTTGPAFEGAQISSGQRATPGAIEHVRIDPATHEPRFRIVGCDLWSDAEGFANDVKAIGITGICGSGIIEAVAEMRLTGLLDASGLIGSPGVVGSCDRLVVDGRTHSYCLYDGRLTDGPEVRITQGDIRAIQLAKAALYAGARLLMDHFGSPAVDRVVLAGAFGAHISPLHALVLGMIPDCPLDKVSSPGNAAGTGARIALCNRDARREIEVTVQTIEKIETAIEPAFQKHFINANAIPHASDAFPNLDQEVMLPDLSFKPGMETSGPGGIRRRRRTR